MSLSFASIYDVADKLFDFVVIGGGTAGSVLARRLSENVQVSVAVLEAGDAHVNDPLILSPNTWGLQFGKPDYDWGFASKPQDGLSGNQLSFVRGKGLGGSSGINCLVWVKPQEDEINMLESLGNPGWNWENFHKYSKKTERVYPQAPPQRAFQGLYDPETVGHDGPLPITFSPTASGGEAPLQKSLNKLGLPTNPDAFGGQSTGTFKALATLNPENYTRSYGANSYIFPVLDRPNLKVLPNAFVTKLVTSGSVNGSLTATAVEFEYDGKPHKVLVGKEAILSAGSIKSPHILELSGIGDRAILEPLGITTKYHNPAIGTNAQEHLSMTGPVHQMLKDKDIITAELLADPSFRSTLQDPYPEIQGPLPLLLTSFSFFSIQQAFAERATALIEKQARKVAEKASTYPPGRKELYEAQLHLMKNTQVPAIEMLVIPYSMVPLEPKDAPFLNIPAGVNHPFSRGTIHAISTDPHVPPEIDPRCYEDEFDIDLFVEGFKIAREAAKLSPLADIIEKEFLPGSNVTSDEDIKAYIRKATGTMWHTAGTCSMMPEDKGGVVDPKLKVYGTSNVRVVDLSILPLIVATHTQATVYAIAEQAADIIKAEHGHSN
ncbi:GMC oxidoreductase [Panus rudis PR-1116 ss-1]|nr:GMC oxidoreductase [Panus rudis PR-1116 ss-1]